MSKKTKKLKNRIKELEKVIKNNSLILTDSENENLSVHISFKSGKLLATYQKLNVEETKMELFNINTQNDEE